jgi:hypothetical protein
MESVDLMFFILLVVLVIFAYVRINPKLDWNYQTGDRLLWFNDPFDSCKRKAITIWRRKKM